MPKGDGLVNTETQCNAILAHLKTGRSITAIEAFRKYQCFRLAARIYDLRFRGHYIRSRIILTTGDKRVAEYWL